MLDWVGNEIEKQQKKTQQSEQALSDYRDKKNALSLDDKQNIVTQRLTRLNVAMIRARMAKAQKDAGYSEVKGMSSSTWPDAIPVIAQNESGQALKTKCSE